MKLELRESHITKGLYLLCIEGGNTIAEVDSEGMQVHLVEGVVKAFNESMELVKTIHDQNKDNPSLMENLFGEAIIRQVDLINEIISGKKVVEERVVYTLIKEVNRGYEFVEISEENKNPENPEPVLYDSIVDARIAKAKLFKKQANQIIDMNKTFEDTNFNVQVAFIQFDENGETSVYEITPDYQLGKELMINNPYI